jgi:Ran GTPase-activating protein (RanGAP) involved in mRNA processing and transport
MEYCFIMSIVVLGLSFYRNSRLEALIAECQPGSMVCLDKQQLTDADIKIVVQQAIISKRCSGLSLAHNDITPEGASFLADALYNNTTLYELWLYANHVSDVGVRYLAQALAVNKTLKKLGLAANDITDAGVPHLVEMVKKNRTLSMLGLAMNKIGDQGVQMLAHALAQQNTSLEILALDRNELVDDSSVDSFIHMIKRNRSIKELWLNGCSLSEKSQKRLQQAAESKKDFKLVTMYEKSS